MSCARALEPPENGAPPPAVTEGGAKSGGGNREARGDRSTPEPEGQLDLWSPPPPPPGPTFDGETFEPALDRERLGSQLERVRELMSDGMARTLAEIVEGIGGGSEASVSARLRDLRKDRFGSLRVGKRRRGDAERGHFEYWIEVRR